MQYVSRLKKYPQEPSKFYYIYLSATNTNCLNIICLTFLRHCLKVDFHKSVVKNPIVMETRGGGATIT